MSVRSEILAQFNQVAKEQDKKLAVLTDNLELMDSGLDSLCLAIIVSRLEDILGIEPFSTAEDVAFPRTVGEFITFYENAAK
jgi:acyl carrier protein